MASIERPAVCTSDSLERTSVGALSQLLLRKQQRFFFPSFFSIRKGTY